MANTPVVLDGEEIAALPWEPLARIGAGVSHRVLWRSGDSIAGVMRIEAGGHVEPHAHRHAHHHLWVLEGTVTVLARDLGPGAYVHVPAGTDHAMAAGAAPAEFLYLYLQPRAS